MANPTNPRRQRQQELRRLLDQLAASGKTTHAVEEALFARGEGRLLLRPGADGAAASWYYRYTDRNGDRHSRCIGVCDPTRTSGLDLDDALFEARKLSDLLKGAAAGDLDTYLAREERRKHDELEGQRRLTAQKDKTLRMLLETYIQWLTKQEKHRSAYDTANALRTHLFKPWPELSAKPAAQVQRAELAKVIRRIFDAGKARTAGKVRSFISAAYEASLNIDKEDIVVPEAFQQFGVEHNPVAAVKFKGSGVQARKRKVARQDLGRLLVLLRMEKSPAAKALRILIDLGGQRQVQLWRVLIRGVDLEAGTLQQLDPKGNRDQPRVHEVPLVGRTRRQVKALVGLSRCKGPELLFTTDGKVPIRDETVRKLFRALAKKVCALSDDTLPPYSLGNIRCTAENQLKDWEYTRQQRGWLLSHGFSGVQSQHYELIEAEQKLREMLHRWQGHLLRLEREARKDMRKRATAGDQRFVAVLRKTPEAKPVHASDGPRGKAGATMNSPIALSVAARNPVADPLLKIRDILELLPISKSTLERLRAGGEFPPPSLHVGRTPLWYRSQIDQFVSGAVAREPAVPDRHPPRLKVVGG